MKKITLNASDINASQFSINEIGEIIPAIRLLYSKGLIPELYYQGLIKITLNLKDKNDDEHLKIVLSKLDEFL